jgi:hypothetical protein
LEGLARLRHRPDVWFLRLFVTACLRTKLEGFKPHELTSMVEGGLG